MKKCRLFLLLFTVIASLILTAAMSGCAQKEEAAQTVAQTEEEKTVSPVAEQETAQAEASTGPELKILDVVSLKGVDANVIVKDVEDITKGDYLEDGEKFISVWIFVKNTGSESTYVDYAPFILVDTNGTEYESSVYTPGVMYESAYVLPGGTFEGPVYFAVPEDAAAYSLKIAQDLIYGTTDYVEIDLQEYAEDPGDSAFAVDFTDYYSGVQLVEMNTAYNYDDKLSLTVNDGYFTESDTVESTEGYKFYQVALSVENLTSEDLDVTLNYSYKLYSPTYNILMSQIALPFVDNEMWVETLSANESKDFVITFEVKEDSTVNYLFVQDFFEENDPVLFNLAK